MHYTIDNISIETENEKLGTYSITYNPYFIFIFTMYNIKHDKKSINNESKINFFCKSLEPLSKYINRNSKLEGHIGYETIVKIIYDLGLIIKTLENKNKGILCFSIDDIIVVNDETFLFINTNKILSIDNNKFMTLKQPISLKESFLTPDTDWNVLPVKTFYTSSYYSFADMIIFILFGEKWDNNINLLNPIIKTKLYYFLLRCLEKEPKNRILLYT